MILWLSGKQFSRELDDLQIELQALRERGLTVRFVDEDYRSYKKFIYTATNYRDSIIVTTDDDTLYKEDWLEKLIITHNDNPGCVSCYRTHYTMINND